MRRRAPVARQRLIDLRAAITPRPRRRRHFLYFGRCYWRPISDDDAMLTLEYH